MRARPVEGAEGAVVAAAAGRVEAQEEGWHELTHPRSEVGSQRTLKRAVFGQPGVNLGGVKGWSASACDAGRHNGQGPALLLS